MSDVTCRVCRRERERQAYIAAINACPGGAAKGDRRPEVCAPGGMSPSSRSPISRPGGGVVGCLSVELQRVALSALDRCGWRYQDAANFLGVNVKTLYLWRKRWSLDRYKPKEARGE